MENLNDVLKTAVLPFPREWENELPFDELHDKIIDYKKTYFNEFLSVIRTYMSNLIDSVYPKDKEIDVSRLELRRLSNKVRKFIGEMFAEYPQFERYRQSIALEYINSSSIDLYFLGSKDIFIFNTMDTQPIINCISVAREILGETQNYDFTEFVKKLNLL